MMRPLCTLFQSKAYVPPSLRGVARSGANDPMKEGRNTAPRALGAARRPLGVPPGMSIPGLSGPGGEGGKKKKNKKKKNKNKDKKSEETEPQQVSHPQLAP